MRLKITGGPEPHSFIVHDDTGMPVGCILEADVHLEPRNPYVTLHVMGDALPAAEVAEIAVTVNKVRVVRCVLP